jgi:hypothetical protein
MYVCLEFSCQKVLDYSLFNRYRLFIQSSWSSVSFSRLYVWRNVHFICCWIFGQKWLASPYDSFNNCYFCSDILSVISDIDNLHIFLGESIEIYEFTLFWQYWGLNSGPHTCWSGALPLDPLHEPCFVLGICHDRVSRTIFPELALNHDPPDFYLLSH